ncbi:MAG: hypothetical protein M1819_005810 [Sarea resinae]|nr:MAG: hypothetical protein M1819_005810 [Sarea resinae]
MIEQGKSTGHDGQRRGWLSLPITTLKLWAALNGISFNGVEVEPLPNKGLAVVAKQELPDDSDTPLMIIPQDMVLSVEGVQRFAKADKYLREVLDATGEYGRTARGAILIFLLMQVTYLCPDMKEKIGVSNSWTEYLKFLQTVPLPTFMSDEERTLVVGTSLEAALNAKLKSLSREFDHLRSSTETIPWCQRCWWDAETGLLTLEDWKHVDAMYRSRALQLPGTGDAMVPCLDMTNHSSGDQTVAAYETDVDGNGLLLLRDGKHLDPGDEITITYGDEKGACEMVFSYGFIEESMKSAGTLFLPLDIPDDDPLRKAKQTVSTAAPGVRLTLLGGRIQWESPYVWLICVNEEDGLEFKIEQTTDGSRELRVSWKDEDFRDTSDLEKWLRLEPLWDVFQLRAVCTLQERVQAQLRRLYESERDVQELGDLIGGFGDSATWDTLMRLRELEAELLEQAYREFEEEVT